MSEAGKIVYLHEVVQQHQSTEAGKKGTAKRREESAKHQSTEAGSNYGTEVNGVAGLASEAERVSRDEIVSLRCRSCGTPAGARRRDASWEFICGNYCATCGHELTKEWLEEEEL